MHARRHASFGEEWLLLDAPARHVSITFRNSQQGYCCLLSLNKPSLLEALRQFPALLKNVSNHPHRHVCLW